MLKGLIYWNGWLGNRFLKNNKNNSRNYFYTYFFDMFMVFPNQNWNSIVLVELKFGKCWVYESNSN